MIEVVVRTDANLVPTLLPPELISADLSWSDMPELTQAGLSWPGSAGLI